MLCDESGKVLNLVIQDDYATVFQYNTFENRLQ